MNLVNIHEVTQAFVAGAVCVGTFVLIGLGEVPADQGLAFLGALLGGLGLGYVNGRKA